MSYANIRPAKCCGNCLNTTMDEEVLICMEHETATDEELVCDLFKMRPMVVDDGGVE